ncbi:MAG: hypothetical protein KC613_06435 [Myxococcales bacterium]|nr:hypothetical protein [Myxococcales bacterium]
MNDVYEVIQSEKVHGRDLDTQVEHVAQRLQELALVPGRLASTVERAEDALRQTQGASNSAFAINDRLSSLQDEADRLKAACSGLIEMVAAGAQAKEHASLSMAHRRVGLAWQIASLLGLLVAIIFAVAPGAILSDSTPLEPIRLLPFGAAVLYFMRQSAVHRRLAVEYRHIDVGLQTIKAFAANPNAESEAWKHLAGRVYGPAPMGASKSILDQAKEIKQVVAVK